MIYIYYDIYTWYHVCYAKMYSSSKGVQLFSTLGVGCLPLRGHVDELTFVAPLRGFQELVLFAKLVLCWIQNWPLYIRIYITYIYIYMWLFIYTCDMCVSMKLLQHAPSMMFAFLQASCSFLQTWPHRYIWLPYNIHLYISFNKEHNFIALTTIWVVWWWFLIGRNSLQNAKEQLFMIIVVFNHFELMSFPRIFQTKNASIILGLLEATPFFLQGKWPTFQWHQTWLDGLGGFGLGIITGFVGFGVVVAKLGKVDSTKNWVLANQMRS